MGRFQGTPETSEDSSGSYLIELGPIDRLSKGGRRKRTGAQKTWKLDVAHEWMEIIGKIKKIA